MKNSWAIFARAARANLRQAPLRRLLSLFAIPSFALLSSTSFAVSVNPQGLGQVLLYPYYTVRASDGASAYSTLFTVTNTTGDTKALRVRFRESRNGREVISVDVFLTPNDSWTGAIVAAAQGPAVISNDQSCLYPPVTGSPRTIPFNNFQYSGAQSDGEDTTIDRAREGYFEVFEMGVVKDATVLAALGTNGQPNCTAALAVTLDNLTKVTAPTGGLMGSANIISVEMGTLYSYDAVALANFSSTSLWAPFTATTPMLADVNPKISRMFNDGGFRESNWDVGKGALAVDPVSAVLMAEQLLNWFVLDAVTESATDWVVTMPTKPYYVNAGNGNATPPRPPFESKFASGGAPDSFGTSPNQDCPVPSGTRQFGREGRTADGCPGFLPPPAHNVSLPWAANIVTFNESKLFGSTIAAVFATPFANGWAKLVPFQYPTGNVHHLTSTDTPPVTYFGLPMIGFMANDYVNRTLTVNGQKVLSNYSATSPHKTITRVL